MMISQNDFKLKTEYDVSSLFFSQAPSSLHISAVSREKLKKTQSYYVELEEERRFSEQALNSVVNDLVFKDQARRESVASLGFSGISNISSLKRI